MVDDLGMKLDESKRISMKKRELGDRKKVKFTQ